MSKLQNREKAPVDAGAFFNAIVRRVIFDELNYLAKN